MSDIDPSQSQPQFGTAEFDGAGPDHCKFCNQPVGMQYYRVGDAMACGSCADNLKRDMPVNTTAGYMRGLLFGCGAALLGTVLYSTVAIVTGWEIGFVALAVGWLVGKAVMKGSNGLGGRRYQITAVVLTYMAVAFAAIPTGLYFMSKQGDAPQAKVEVADNKTPDSNATEAKNADAAADAAADDSDEDKADAAEAGGEKEMSFGMAILTLLGVGLASPFLALADPGQGLIGLVILFVGIHTAWNMTKAADMVVDGPFDNSASMTAKAGG
jgi:hypothetical protein